MKGAASVVCFFGSGFLKASLARTNVRVLVAHFSVSSKGLKMVDDVVRMEAFLLF